MSPRLALPLLVLCTIVHGGCMAPTPMPTVDRVDLDRFMGDWYVLAHVPAGVEKDAYDAVESYALDDDGTIATVYRFRRGGFDGPEKVYRPRGFVKNTETNAEWRMQFLWPFKSEYLVVALDEDYEWTIIGRTKRDYAWIMARTPQLPDGELDGLVERLVALGYDDAGVRIVPHAAASER
jgi:apolipoprotein D and lipocalin family protein